MVKVYKMTVESTDGKHRNIVVELIADTMEEVEACGNSGENIVGLTANDTLVLGSVALCVNGKVALLSSTGQWTSC